MSHPSAPVDPSHRAALPPAALLRLLDRLESQALDPHAIVIAHSGTVVFEAAWAPYRLAEPALVYSASKTFTAFAIGFLAAEGRLRLDDPVDAHLDLPNPHLLTIAHLLTMSTGHSREQTLALALDPRALATTPPEHTPGGHFAYNSPATLTLARIVAAITGQSLTGYLRPRLLDPLGIGPRWWAELDGFEQGFSGFHLTAGDLATAATLLADGGTWQGRQVLPADFAAAMVQPWSDTSEHEDPPIENGEPDTAVPDWARGYGYQVWRSRHGFRLDGAYGQFGIAVPERHLTIGYQGATTDAQATLSALWDFVESAETGAQMDDDAATTLARRVASLDSWGARARLVPQQEAERVKARLVPDGAGGWLLDLADETGLDARGIRVHDAWSHLDLGAESGVGPAGAGMSGLDLPPDPRPFHLPLAVRATAEPGGATVVHVVATATPHRLIIVREPDGATTASWHTTPLWWPTLTTLAVPRELA